MYKILESQSSSSHLADYFLYNNDGQAESGIFHMKNMVDSGDAITIENSFLTLGFDRSGLMEVCSEGLWRAQISPSFLCVQDGEEWGSPPGRAAAEAGTQGCSAAAYLLWSPAARSMAGSSATCHTC